MAQALASLGHQVCLAAPLSPPLPSGWPPPWPELARLYGLKMEFPLEGLPASPRLRRYDYGLNAVRWARDWKADMLYTRLPQAAALASQMGLATILEMHDLPQGWSSRQLFRLFLGGRGARRLVVITHALANDLRDNLGVPDRSPFTVIAPDGVDLERYEGLGDASVARAALAADLSVFQDAAVAGRFTIGYTGNLYAGRGAELILALAQRLPAMNFLVVGGGPDEVSALRAEATRQNIHNLSLTGFVPNADVPRYQAACDVLLMPYQQRVAASSGGDISRYLSPMKVFEYLACGRVILSGDLPVLREVLNQENAILLPLDDLDAWVTALQELMSDPERRARLARQARQDAQRYTWEGRAALILSGLTLPAKAGNRDGIKQG